MKKILDFCSDLVSAVKSCLLHGLFLLSVQLRIYLDSIITSMKYYCILSENVYWLILKNIQCYLRNHLLIHNNREKSNLSLTSSFFCSFWDLYWVASINKTFFGRTAEIMFEKYKVPALFLAKNAVCFPYFSIFMMFPLRLLILCCFVVLMEVIQ